MRVALIFSMGLLFSCLANADENTVIGISPELLIGKWSIDFIFYGWSLYKENNAIVLGSFDFPKWKEFIFHDDGILELFHLNPKNIMVKKLGFWEFKKHIGGAFFETNTYLKIDFKGEKECILGMLLINPNMLYAVYNDRDGICYYYILIKSEK